MNCENCGTEAASLFQRGGGVWVCVVCIPLYERRQREEEQIERIIYLLDRIDDGQGDILNAIERLPT